MNPLKKCVALIETCHHSCVYMLMCVPLKKKKYMCIYNWVDFVWLWPHKTCVWLRKKLSVINYLLNKYMCYLLRKIHVLLNSCWMVKKKNMFSRLFSFCFLRNTTFFLIVQSLNYVIRIYATGRIQIIWSVTFNIYQLSFFLSINL